MTTLMTKTTLLFTACSLASALSWAEVPPVDASVTSANSANSQNSTQVKTETGGLTTSTQSQNSTQHQIGLSLTKPEASPAANTATAPVTNNAAPAASTTTTTAPVANNSTATTPPASNSSTTQTSNQNTQTAVDQTTTSLTSVSQSVNGKVSEQVQSLSAGVDSGVKNAVGIADKETAAVTNAIKNQADFAQATANSITAHTQTTLASATDNVRDVQASTSAAVNDAVKSGVTDSVSAATNTVLNQEVSNQVNNAVKQEIGKTIQSSVTNSVTNSVTQNIGLGL